MQMGFRLQMQFTPACATLQEQNVCVGVRKSSSSCRSRWYWRRLGESYQSFGCNMLQVSYVSLFCKHFLTVMWSQQYMYTFLQKCRAAQACAPKRTKPFWRRRSGTSKGRAWKSKPTCWKREETNCIRNCLVLSNCIPYHRHSVQASFSWWQADDETGMTVLKETSDAVSSYYKEHAQAAEVGLTSFGYPTHKHSPRPNLTIGHRSSVSDVDWY